MHELSLAENMVDAALQAEGVTPENLRTFHISCSCLAGVNLQSLEFCVQLVCEQRRLAEVHVMIRETPAKLQCECGCCYNAHTVFAECPDCGSCEHRIAEAGDVLLESVEVEND